MNEGIYGMVKNLKFLNCLFWSLLQFGCIVLSPKLNIPRILLPVRSDIPSSFTLKTTEGCFKWFSSNSDILRLDYQGDCSNYVNISAISLNIHREPIKVVARNQDFELKCDVKIDLIVKIALKTTTKILYTEDAPELFEVQAYNSQNDTFSSINGIKFNWVIQNSGDIVRFVALSQSAYKPYGYIDGIENDIHVPGILIEASKSGIAHVNVRILDTLYKNVPSETIKIIVLENLHIIPTDKIYLIKQATLHLKVFQILLGGKSERFDLIKHNNYKFILLADEEGNARCCLNNDKMTGLQLGRCIAKLHNSDFTENIAQESLPKTEIEVVEAASLEAKIFPGNIWVTEVNKLCTITLKLFDARNNEIWPTDDIKIEAKNIDKSGKDDFYEIRSVNKNGTIFIFKPKRPGIVQLAFQYLGIGDVDDNICHLDRGDNVDSHESLILPIIEIKVTVDIVPSIKLYPNRAVIPFDPHNSNVVYNVTFKAQGGSGTYDWKSTNSSLSRIDHEGNVNIYPTQIGECTIVVSDKKNPFIIATGMNSDPMLWKTVLVLLPHQIYLDPHVESYVNSTTAHVYIKMSGKVMQNESDEIFFTDCRQVKINAYVEDPDIFQLIYKDDFEGYDEWEFNQNKSYCRELRVIAHKQGTTTLHVNYMYPQLDINIRSTTTLHAYHNIRIDNTDIKSLGHTVLALGSSRTFHLSGGPLPWIHHDDKLDISFIIKIDVGEGISYRKIDDIDCSKPDLRIYEITCEKLGYWTTNLTIGHEASFLLTPLQSAITLNITCSEPKYLNLKPIYDNYDYSHVNIRTLPNGKSIPHCPLISSKTTPARYYPHLLNRPVMQIDVNVLDSNRMAFYNFSSLQFEWSFKPQSMQAFIQLEVDSCFETVFVLPSLNPSSNLEEEEPSPHTNYKYVQKIKLSNLISINLDPSTQSGMHDADDEDINGELNFNMQSADDVIIEFSDYYLVDVLARITGYKHSLFDLKKVLIFNYDLPPNQHLLISHQLTFKLVPPLQLNPTTNLTLLNDPSTIGRLNITHGSGYFYVTSSKRPHPDLTIDKSVLPLSQANSFEDTVIKAIYFDNNFNNEEWPHIKIQTLAEGKSDLYIYDLCFSRQPTTIHNNDELDESNNLPYVKSVSITVTTIASIIIDIPNNIEVDTENIIKLSFVNPAGQTFHISTLPILQVKPIIQNPEVIIIRPTINSNEDDNDQNMYYMYYTVKGLKIGQTSLSFQTLLGGSGTGKQPIDSTITYPSESTFSLKSDDHVIKVFPNLILQPEHIILIPGSIFQFKYYGGFPDKFEVFFDLIDPVHFLLSTSTNRQRDGTPGQYDDSNLPPVIANITTDGIITTFKTGKIAIRARMISYTDSSETNGGLSSSQYQTCQCEAYARVEILQLQDFRIFTPITKIQIGNEVPIRLKGYYGSEREPHFLEDGVLNSLFSFASKSFLPAPFHVRWSIDSPRNLACQIIGGHFNLPNLSLASSQPFENNFEMTVKATSKGECKILVEVSYQTAQPSSSMHENIFPNLRHPNGNNKLTNLMKFFKREIGGHDSHLDQTNSQNDFEYFDTIVLESFEPLQISSQSSNLANSASCDAYDDSCSKSCLNSLVSHILMTPGSKAKLITKKISQKERNLLKFKARALDRKSELYELLQIDQLNGIVSTKSITSDANIIMNPSSSLKNERLNFDEASFLITASYFDQILQANHSAHLFIDVKGVSYLSLNVLNFANSNISTIIPIGYQMKIEVRAHDEYGNIFDATNLIYTYRLNRYDLCSFGDNSPQLIDINVLQLTCDRPGQSILQVCGSHSRSDGQNLSELAFIKSSNSMCAYLIIHSQHIIYPYTFAIMNIDEYTNQFVNWQQTFQFHEPVGEDDVYELEYGDVVFFELLLPHGNMKSENGNILFYLNHVGLLKGLGKDVVIQSLIQNSSIERTQNTFIKINIRPMKSLQFLPFYIKNSQRNQENYSLEFINSFPSLQSQQPFISEAQCCLTYKFPFVKPLIHPLNHIVTTKNPHSLLTFINGTGGQEFNFFKESLNQLFSCKLEGVVNTEESTVNIANLFESRVDFDFKNGYYFCEIEPKKSTDHNIYGQMFDTSRAASVPTSLKLVVYTRAPSLENSMSLERCSMILQYYPKYGINLNQLYLSPMEPMTNLKIFSPLKTILLSLQIQLIDDKQGVIDVMQPEPDSDSQNNAMKVPIKLRYESPNYYLASQGSTTSEPPSEYLIMRLIIHSTITGQNESVSINVKKADKKLTLIYEDGIEDITSRRKGGLIETRRRRSMLNYMLNYAFKNYRSTIYWILITIFTTLSILLGCLLFYPDFAFWHHKPSPPFYPYTKSNSPYYRTRYMPPPHKLSPRSIHTPIRNTFNNSNSYNGISDQEFPPNTSPRHRHNRSGIPSNNTTTGSNDTKLWSVGRNRFSTSPQQRFSRGERN